jgi:hypothetical protein
MYLNFLYNISLCYLFFDIVESLYNKIKHFTNLKNNNIHNNIYLYLNETTNKWKNNKIDNIELVSDILLLYNKYNIIPQLNDVNNYKNENKNENDKHMKYYILGWYMYQNLKNNENNQNSENEL